MYISDQAIKIINLPRLLADKCNNKTKRMNFNVSLSKKMNLAVFILLELLVAIGCEGRELARKDSSQNSASSNVWK